MTGPFPHDPPQVLTTVAYTCQQCEGSGFYTDEVDGLCHCEVCSSGYVVCLVPLHELLALHPHLPPALLHDAVATLAAACRVRLPALTHSTANLSVGQLPKRKRINLLPLGAPKAPAQKLSPQSAETS
jgi:hypothetical protein